MHHLITAIFMTSMMKNTSNIKNHLEVGAAVEAMPLKCDMKETCSEGFDTQSPLATFTLVHNIVLTIVGICGIIGNVLSIIVLSRPQMKSSNNYLLIGLTLCDTFVVAFAILITGLGSIFSSTGYFFEINFYYLPYVYIWCIPLWYTAQVSSVYLTIAITVERYIAVCFPFRSKDFLGTNNAIIWIFFIVFVSLLYHIPTFLENDVVSIKHDACNITMRCTYITDFGRNQMYLTVYWKWLHSILTFLIPFATLAFFNISIARAMNKGYERRRELTGSQKIEKDQTTILLWIVAVFFFCNSSFPIMYVYHYFFSHRRSLIASMINQVAMSMFVFNSCVNFIIYIMVGRKFKKVFIKTFSTTESSKITTLRYS